LGVTDGNFTPARNADSGGKMILKPPATGGPKCSPCRHRYSREARHISADFHSTGLHPQITVKSIKPGFPI
jgi:hypothetical protein